MAYPFACSPPAAIASKNLAGLDALGQQLEVGDIVFTRISFPLFCKVADTTSSWTKHVGIVIDIADHEPLIAESRVPFSGTASWSSFVRRSACGRVALARLNPPPDAAQHSRLAQAARKRMHILYDTGFNLHSRRQFCSRFVREVVDEATGIKLGEVESFAGLLASNPQADLRFWRLWYVGRIPWQRETVTPSSLLGDDRLTIYFDGHAADARPNRGAPL